MLSAPGERRSGRRMARLRCAGESSEADVFVVVEVV